MRKNSQTIDPQQHIKTNKQIIQQILSKPCAKQIKIKLLQGFRQDIKHQVAILNQISESIKKQQILSTSFSDGSSPSQQQQLWEEIDDLEYKILQTREKKIYLNSMLQQYEQQLQEYRKLASFRQNMNKKLNFQLRKKRKQLQLQKSKESNSQHSLISKSLQNVSSFIGYPFKSFWK